VLYTCTTSRFQSYRVSLLRGPMLITHNKSNKALQSAECTSAQPIAASGTQSLTLDSACGPPAQLGEDVQVPEAVQRHGRHQISRPHEQRPKDDA